MSDERHPFDRWLEDQCGFTQAECGVRLLGYLRACWNAAVEAGRKL